jgi:hypothetical protein
MGGCEDKVEDRTVLGFEPTPLGVAEPVLGDLERGEIGQGLTGALQALLETCGQRAGRREAAVTGAHHGGRVAEQGPAAALGRGRPPGRDQDLRLVAVEPVPVDRGQYRLLLVTPQAGQGVADSGTDGALLEALLDLAGQPRRKGMPSRHPALAATEQARCGGQGQAIIADERVDGPGLVHGGCGPGRSVGPEHEELELDGRARPLNDDGHVGLALAAPALEAPEAIGDLEAAVGLRDRSQRQLGQRARRTAAGSAPQPGKARSQASQRELQDLRRAAIDRRRGVRRYRLAPGDGAAHGSGR